MSDHTKTFIVDGRRLSADECKALFREAQLVERQRKVLDFIEGERVLDVGCYIGTFVAAVKHRFPNVDVIGIDYFPDHIEIARIVYPELANHFVRMSVYDLKFDDETLDCVTLQEVIEHLENVAHAVKEVNRVLKIGGVAVISVPNPFHLSSMLSFFRFEIRNILRRWRGTETLLGTEVFFKEIEWNRHIFAWTPQTLLTLFTINGFEYVGHNYEYAGNTVLERFLLKVFPFLGPTQILKVRKLSSCPKEFV